MKSKILRVSVITMSWVLLAALLFFYAHAYLVVTLPPGQIHTGYQPALNFIGFVLPAFLGGLAFGYHLVFRSHYWTRKRPFSYGIFYNTVLFLGVYLTTAGGVTALLAWYADADAAVWDVVWGVLTNPASLVTMLLWALIIAGTQFLLQVSDTFGQGVLWNFIIGRYHQPREEERIFMFLDLEASTTIAEQLGHTQYFNFISQFVADVTDPILAHRGEIYQYVGDEIVVSWKTGDAAANANSVRCFFAIEDHIARLAPGYAHRFGVVPQFKAGLHCGKVMVGEIGVVKKDIIFSGDVLNTTSRIQGACNTYERRLLISTVLLRSLTLDAGYTVLALDQIQLKGKAHAVELNALRRLPAQA